MLTTMRDAALFLKLQVNPEDYKINGGVHGLTRLALPKW